MENDPGNSLLHFNNSNNEFRVNDYINNNLQNYNDNYNS